jgi:sodium transport system ATP-binding protein
MIVADNLHKAFDTRTGRIQAVANVGFRAGMGRSPACSAPTVPARPPPCACSTR